ncbi:glycosyltransferase family 2 protein [Aetokthonos hydrillicola Thurmond2011]|jgi:glycosyltransferase involved in cell wall biosynthesis|uniref:Glycosyltransferase family 2 protein n=1 Tax=Aetokthonos hydrillicola Thurmond2011 TaxID=2712845 RepID=A0AAP5I2J2_9CYAN|nr:glycosyltransferase family A protein [Aetokthonos hydrillicola]MBO3460915.1 glycosyltransferase family 2 protein [Aetokthonos hydrillicola CCALA 1050]MBW4586464.1 glycosyltransferase family 2 protein [Aetokthonos hydrillicola CCALA 1050]MDR9893591.1 glycosyltransferase family 2 protein [Aetokthonos hydrillicola Thurmond2011]
MPKVSVVIPAYNAMAFLPETLESVLKQTFTDFEVLIVNDGSSDHIVEWASQITDPRVRLITQENQRVSAARNTGIANAQGEYIAFLDADDLWEPAKLEKQVLCLDNNPEVGLVYTWTLLVDKQNKPTGRIFASDVEGKAWDKILENDMISSGSCPMVRRCCFEAVGVFDRDLAYAPDLDMWVRIAFRYPIAVVKEPLVRYRQIPNSFSRNREKMTQDLRQVIEKTFQCVPLDLLYLRNRCYASIILPLAWLAIDEGDYKKAIHFRQQAFLHYPQVCFSEKFIRLSLAIFMIRWFGPRGYDGVRNLTHILRQSMLGVFS